MACSRLLRPDEPWCPLCHEPAPDPRFRTGGAFAPSTRADDHAGPAAAPLRDWQHSRTAGSEVTFGIVGRVVLTVLLLGMTFFAFQFSPVMGIMMVVVGLPWALRDTWRRIRIPR